MHESNYYGSDDEDPLDVKPIFDGWMATYEWEEQCKLFITMAFHAMNTFNCTPMEAYSKVSTVCNVSTTTVRILQVLGTSQYI